MSSLEHYDTAQPTLRERLEAWRALPRLLVSRRWRWLTLAVILIAVGLLRLGFWQLDRLQQRRAENALIEQRFNAPPLTFTGQPLDVEANEYRRVVVEGEYDTANEVVLRNRSRGGLPGMEILTPLRIAGSEQSVLVNRGWVPLLEAEPTARAAFAVSGPLRIEAVIRKPQPTPAGGWGPKDRPQPGQRLDAWFRADVAQIQRQVPQPLLPLYLEQLPIADRRALPQPQPNIDFRSEGSHLSYALQWFSFATIGLCGYAAFVVTRSQPER